MAGYGGEAFGGGGEVGTPPPPPDRTPAWTPATLQMDAEKWLPTPAAPETTGYIMWWNGTEWLPKPVKVWNGTTWVVKPVKYWDGSAFVTT